MRGVAGLRGGGVIIPRRRPIGDLGLVLVEGQAIEFRASGLADGYEWLKRRRAQLRPGLNELFTTCR